MEPIIHLHQGDLSDSVTFKESVAVDTETMGLNPHRDRLCLVQLSGGDGICHLVQLNQSRTYDCPHLKKILSDPKILKIFHFARFDVATLQHFLRIRVKPVYCTKIASKLVRTFGDRHSLRDLCRELIGVEISKEQQSSDWGVKNLSPEQQTYAATDVLYLHRLKNVLDEMLKREGRLEIAQRCFDFMPTCADLDLLGYERLSVLEH